VIPSSSGKALIERTERAMAITGCRFPLSQD
jgi:hypothetical protein